MQNRLASKGSDPFRDRPTGRACGQDVAVNTKGELTRTDDETGRPLPFNTQNSPRTAWRFGLLLSLAMVGCQTTRPRPPVSGPGSDPAQNQLSYPVGNQDSEATATATPLSASAQIRGQSGSGWFAAPAEEDDDLKQPLPASDPKRDPKRDPQPATLTSNPQQSGSGLELPAPTGGAQPQFTPGVPSSTTVLQPPNPQPYGYIPPNDLGQAPSAPVYGANPYGAAPPPAYGTPGAYGVPGSYGASVAPGATQPMGASDASMLAPGVYPPGYDPRTDPMNGIDAVGLQVPGYQPRERMTPLDVYLQEGRTGRVILGGSVNSDLGVAGQVVIEERNFDIRRFPRSWNDMWSGRAFRGDGQNFRAELMPGTQVERYTVNWSTPNMLGYLPYSLSVGGFYYTRQFRDWTEQRLGGRVALGYNLTKDMSFSSELRMEDVTVFDPRVAGVPELDSALGSNDLYTARFRLARDTRDSPFMSTEGALLELVYDQVFGEYDYPRGQINYSRYFLVRERPDGTGRHTVASTFRVGISGSQTPIFENFYAGGYSTLRGFSFRGASPVVDGVQVGGELSLLGSLEYLFPLTADEMLRGVAFVDYGTVEQNIELTGENFRVAPGLGLRVTVPALGPAPLAFDFALPVSYADTDDRQTFSFYMGFTR